MQEALTDAGAATMLFSTPVISDAETMGTEGMKYSLPSRDLIADCIELMHEGYRADAMLTLSGCDKTIPAALMPIARGNNIGITLYGGTIRPGTLGDPGSGDINIVSVFEAVGAESQGSASADDVHRLECAACPGHGSCGGFYTANTMASVNEALGMSLPGTASHVAANADNSISEEKIGDCVASVAALMTLIEDNIRARDIMTREAFENAVTVMQVCVSVCVLFVCLCVGL